MKVSNCRLIINADDFGQTLGISRGIATAFNHGVVTSTSLMVNSVHTKEAVHLLKSRQIGIPIGLHFNLTFGKPVCNPLRIPSLVNGSGEFPATFKYDELVQGPTIDIAGQVNHVLDGFQKRARYEDVRRELVAQFEVFTRIVGHLPSHLDSHHHIHQIPMVLDVIKELAFDKRLRVRQISDTMRADLQKHQIPTTDAFIDTFWGEKDLNLAKERFIDAVKRIKRSITEWVCHPGYTDLELNRTSLYSWQRDVELKLLCSKDVIDCIAQRGIILDSDSKSWMINRRTD